MTHLGRSLNSDMGDFPWIRGWALTRTGMAHDLLGQREEALRAYREATRVREGAGRRYAERFIRQPYRGTKEELKPER
ncbi:MAG: hypothetical protein HYV08_17530 [Deltaproteobacteria bacterium]|nr:hypothetical protein [Deltaproteobacteria bacterium]